MPSIQLSFSLIADSSGKVSASHDENPLTRVKLTDMTVRSTAGPSTTGCRSRTHNVSGGFSGGATFPYSGTLTDCTNLFIDLNSLAAPPFTTTTLSFTLDGFDPGEAVELEGSLNYTISIFEHLDSDELMLLRLPRVARVNTAYFAQSVARVEAGVPAVHPELLIAHADLTASNVALLDERSDGGVETGGSHAISDSTGRAANLNLAVHPTTRDAIPEGTDGGSRINRAKSLILLWFSLYDIRSRQADQDILDLLDPRGFEVSFPDATLHSPDEFRTWYRNHFSQVKRGYHEIHDVSVSLLDQKSCSVLLQPLLHAELPNGQLASMSFTIQAKVSEDCGRGPRIQKYSAVPIVPI